jgi:hypothetical protein
MNSAVALARGLAAFALLALALATHAPPTRAASVDAATSTAAL